MSLNDIAEIINSSSKIALTFHVSPDGDSLGSALALGLALNKYNKDAYIISKDKVPSVYNFIPYSNKINTAQSIPSEGTDCVIVLDCGDKKRISADIDLGTKSYKLVNIDHHLSNDAYGDMNFIDTGSSAVGEIIFDLIKLLGIPMDKEISECLYTSIVSDTGGFRHSNTTPRTHTIASELVSIGINFNKIHQFLFQSKNYKRLKLYGLVLDSMYLIENDKVCIMKLTNDMLLQLNTEASDTADIISLGMDIDTVEVAVLLKEQNNDTKVSLRSKFNVDVRKIAESFGGGGHTKASGLTLNIKIEEAENIMIDAVKNEMMLWME